MTRKLGPGRKSLERRSTFKVPRAAMKRKNQPKRTQPKRDWTEARAKVEEEGSCRLYGYDLGCAGQLHAAHVIGREHDDKKMPCRFPLPDGRRCCECDTCQEMPRGLPVKAIRIVPLCRVHHDRYDGRAYPRIDLLPALTLDEQLQAVRDAGGLELARKRLAPTAYLSGRVREEEREDG